LESSRPAPQVTVNPTPKKPFANSSGMMYYHTGGEIMATSKIAITIDQNTLNRLDLLVKSRIFPNRSRAIQEAVMEKLERLEKSRLARECAKLDPIYEQALSEEGFGTEIDEWPEY
jgi:Arc/MetJ-type ribon-helix-helix transcriptional regulator